MCYIFGFKFNVYNGIWSNVVEMMIKDGIFVGKKNGILIFFILIIIFVIMFVLFLINVVWIVLCGFFYECFVFCLCVIIVIVLILFIKYIILELKKKKIVYLLVRYNLVRLCKFINNMYDMKVYIVIIVDVFGLYLFFCVFDGF